MPALYHAAQRPLLTAFAVAMLCLALVVPLLSQRTAQAQTVHVVTSSANDGPGSLRQAVNNAFAGDTITFADGLSTITLTEQIVIDEDLTIDGPGADLLTISSDGSDRIFYVEGNGAAAISGVTITGGGDVANGGAIYLHTATLTIENSIISGNAAISLNGNAAAGAIANAFGDLTVSNSTISGNTVTAYIIGNAGGIHNLDGTVTITNSTITDNTVNGGNGGGISNYGGTVTITGSTISGNQTNPTSSTQGGGIYNAGGTLHVTSTTISGNGSGNAGGGIFGVDLSQTSVSDITITSSTISGNTADRGAGIDITGGSATIRNTIIAGNLTGENCSAGTAAPTSLGHNLDSDDSCNLTEATDLPNTDPLLGELADNGGPTWTHAIDVDSPAYNAGGDAPCATSPDQRGAPRPQAGACDIGAFEVGDIIGPPLLTLPEDITVEAAGPDGAVVTFDPSAVDGNNQQIDVTCDPASGSTFDIGTREVECHATDDYSQTVTGTFNVTVLGTEHLLAQLIQDVGNGDIPAFLKPRLLVFLSTADLALDRGNTAAACHTLQQFSDQVLALSPRYIAPALAEQLGDDAQGAREALGCNSR